MTVFCPDLEFNWMSVIFDLGATRTWRCYAVPWWIALTHLLAKGIQNRLNGIRNRLNGINDAATSVRIDVWYCHLKTHWREDGLCMYLSCFSLQLDCTTFFALFCVNSLNIDGYSNVLWVYWVKWGLCLRTVPYTLASDTVTSCFS